MSANHADPWQEFRLARTVERMIQWAESVDENDQFVASHASRMDNHCLYTALVRNWISIVQAGKDSSVCRFRSSGIEVVTRAAEARVGMAEMTWV